MSSQKAHKQMNLYYVLSREASSLQKYAVITAAFLLFFTAGLVLSLSIGPETQPSRGTVITEDNINDILSRFTQTEASASSADTSYTIIMTPSWHFETGSSISEDAYVENSADNQNTVYFTVTLPEESLPIYVSSHLPTGSSADNIQLNTNLAAGSYDATLTYYLLDEADTCISKIPTKLEIIVEH